MLLLPLYQFNGESYFPINISVIFAGIPPFLYGKVGQKLAQSSEQNYVPFSMSG